MKRKIAPLLSLAAAVVMGACLVISFGYSLHELLRRQPQDLRVAPLWEDRGPTPLAADRFTPQGMAWVDGRLLLANTWKDARSRVYEIDPQTMEALRTFDMPDEAVHTSGLAWDGRWLWAVDYRSNRAYRIDLEASLSSGSASVTGSFGTGLRGTSACTVVPWEGISRLAVSDFNRSRKTILVDVESALSTDTAEGNVVFEYRNEAFSQGLTFFGGSLYEAENKFGIDVINRIDPERLALTRKAQEATVQQILGPAKGIEDLAWDGEYLWTSDETTFRIYRTRWP